MTVRSLPGLLMRGVGAETLKMKRSLALSVALVIPLLPTFANVASALQTGLGPQMEEGITLSPWSLFFRYTFRLWTIFALPMVVAIISALVAHTDHQTKAWKMLLALPISRQAAFGGKWIVLAGMLLLSNMVFMAANLMGGVLVNLLRPELGMGLPIPLGEALSVTLISWALSLLMVSIHLWISLRWPGFLASLTLGFIATVSNLFLIGSYLYGRVSLSPWAMPVQIYGDWQASMPVALGGALLVGGLACWDFVTRDVY